MKLKSVIFLVLIWSNSFGQVDSIEIYRLDELKMNYDKDTIYGLDLSRTKLDSVPYEIKGFSNLIYLNLGKNKISELPNWIPELKSIEIINLEKNRFTSFPIQFCRMPGVKELIINRNNIETLPSCIELMKNLEILDLYDCAISTLPESLNKMENLKEIDFSGIRFSPSFQDSWNDRLPHVNIIFDAPCDCME